MVPFVVEHFGRWGEDAIALAKRLAPPPPHGRSEALAELYQDVACAVQRSNADAILAAAVRAGSRGRWVSSAVREWPRHASSGAVT